MKWQNVIQLISKKKEKNVVFKSKISGFSEIAKIITALANIDSGYIVIGLDLQNLHVIGANISSEWLESNISNKICSNLKYKLFNISKSEKNLLVLKIKKQDFKPFYYDKVCYIYDSMKEDVYVSLFENKLKTQSNIQKLTKIASSKSELNERQNEAIKYLKKRSEIKNKVYRELCKVSHKTAHLELIDLVTKGIIEQKGAGRSTKYTLKTA